MSNQIAAAEFKRKFSDFLGRIVFKHERFIITRRGKPVAEILPVQNGASHIAEVKGWLDDSDPFFNLMDSIVEDRQKHKPRAFSDPA